MSALTVWLVEVDAYHLASGHVHRFFFATASGYQAQRSDSDPDRVYVPLVDQALTVALTITSVGETTGATKVQIGDTHLANTKGARFPVRGVDLNTGAAVTLAAASRPLNPLWTDYALGGQRLVVLVGPSTGARDQDFATMLVGHQEMPGLERDALILHPRDRALDFDTPLLVETYAGTGGTEGGPDLKGKTKERCFGHVLSLSPTYLGIINGHHSYSTNGGHPIRGVSRFSDGYVDLTEVMALPTPGQWSQDRSTGIITLGGASGQSPVADGATCALEGDASFGSYRATIADLIAFWATLHSGILPTAAVDAAAFAAFNAAVPYTIGLWLAAGDTSTLRSVCDQAATSAHGFWLIDETERLTIGQVQPASAPALRTLTSGVDHQGLTPQPATNRDTLPAKAALIHAGRNYAVTTPASVGTTVTGDALAFATTEWRDALSPTDAPTLAIYGPTARQIERQTLLTSQTDAALEALALRDDAKVARQIYQLPCTRPFPELVRLAVVTVVDDLPGFENGKMLRVIGVSVDQRAGVTMLTLRE